MLCRHGFGMNSTFDPSCRRCPRLAAFLDVVAAPAARVFLQARAAVRRSRGTPADRGSRARHAWREPHRAPFHRGSCRDPALRNAVSNSASQALPISTAADDGLSSHDARITNSVKCLPPDNKPLPLEIKTCNAYLRAELAQSSESPGDSRAGDDCARRGAARMRFAHRPPIGSRTAPSMRCREDECCSIPIIAAATTRRRAA